MGPLTVLLASLSVLSVLGGAAHAQSGAGPEGCYRFDRPLGHSATGERERGDSSWYTVRLRPGGAVARPRLQSAYWREQYARRSSWRAGGDTLFVRVFTGLVGWDLTLRPEAKHYAGVAQYLSDAVAVGQAPPRYRVRAVREACPPAPPA